MANYSQISLSEKLPGFINKKYIIALTIVSFISALSINVAHADSVPFYVKPFVWILDFILGILGGINDPMDHVFNLGSQYPKWGLYTPEQFYSVPYRGFMMFSVLAAAMVVSSITKSGILMGLKHFSTAMKFEFNETLIKMIIASVLLTHLFTLVGGLFSVNDYLVNLVRSDLRGQLQVQDINTGVNLPVESNSIITVEKIMMNDVGKKMNAADSPVAVAVVDLASKGIGIWWEAFYLQRKFMISLLLVLAPLWICCMFYPMLHGIMFTALKELWSQIIAQALHASLFWAYVHLFDNNMGWLQTLMAMCMFIPISESVRFVFGATSGAGGKIAMAGALAGGAGIMNMTKAVTSLGKGAINAGKSYGGAQTTNSRTGGASFPSTNDISGGMTGGGGRSGSIQGTGQGGIGKTASPFVRRLRAASEFGSGVGSAAFRLAGTFAGSGLGPMGMIAMGEIGGRAGEAVGYSSGGAAMVGAEGIMNVAKNAANKARTFPSNFKEEFAKQSQDINKPTRVLSAAYSAAKGKPSPRGPEYPAQQLEKKAQRFGAAGEIIMGRGGYDQGDAFARQTFAGRVLSQDHLSALNATNQGQVYTVETSDGSYVATKDAGGNYNPISNYGKGNASLKKGQTVVTGYKVQGSGPSVRMLPMKEQVVLPTNDGSEPKIEYVNSSHLHDQSGKTGYSGKTVDPNQFIGRSNKENHIDVRRQNFKSSL
jgi:hypothetical protein